MDTTNDAASVPVAPISSGAPPQFQSYQPLYAPMQSAGMYAMSGQPTFDQAANQAVLTPQAEQFLVGAPMGAPNQMPQPAQFAPHYGRQQGMIQMQMPPPQMYQPYGPYPMPMMQQMPMTMQPSGYPYPYPPQMAWQMPPPQYYPQQPPPAYYQTPEGVVMMQPYPQMQPQPQPQMQPQPQPLPQPQPQPQPPQSQIPPQPPSSQAEAQDPQALEASKVLESLKSDPNSAHSNQTQANTSFPVMMSLPSNVSTPCSSTTMPVGYAPYPPYPPMMYQPQPQPQQLPGMMQHPQPQPQGYIQTTAAASSGPSTIVSSLPAKQTPSSFLIPQQQQQQPQLQSQPQMQQLYQQAPQSFLQPQQQPQAQQQQQPQLQPQSFQMPSFQSAPMSQPQPYNPNYPPNFMPQPAGQPGFNQPPPGSSLPMPMMMQGGEMMQGSMAMGMNPNQPNLANPNLAGSPMGMNPNLSNSMEGTQMPNLLLHPPTSLTSTFSLAPLMPMDSFASSGIAGMAGMGGLGGLLGGSDFMSQVNSLLYPKKRLARIPKDAGPEVKDARVFARKESSRLSSKRARDIANTQLLQSRHDVLVLEAQRGCLQEFIRAIEESEGHLGKQTNLLDKGLVLLQVTTNELVAGEKQDGSLVDGGLREAEVNYKAMSFDQIYKIGTAMKKTKQAGAHASKMVSRLDVLERDLQFKMLNGGQGFSMQVMEQQQQYQGGQGELDSENFEDDESGEMDTGGALTSGSGAMERAGGEGVGRGVLSPDAGASSMEQRSLEEMEDGHEDGPVEKPSDQWQ